MRESTQSSLSDNGAGAIAYITFLPAIAFLVLPPYNKSSFVRFHAWQSIFLAVAWVALFVILAILARVPLFGLIIFPIMLLVDLGMLVLWILALIKALNGVRFRLPIIGALAASQAGR